MTSGKVRAIVGLASALIFVLVGLILWAGFRERAVVERLIAEGQVAQGDVRDDSPHDMLIVDYAVDGRSYSTSIMRDPDGRDRRPLLDEAPVDVPRLGPSDLLQIVYLPSDPATARLRDRLKPGMIPYLAAGGFFSVFGLVLGLVAWIWPFRLFETQRMDTPLGQRAGDKARRR